MKTSNGGLYRKHVPFSGRGYVVALRFWEQLLGGSRNLLQMQCWAGTLGPGVSVVQPFLLPNRSRLGLSFASGSTAVSQLGLSALYNMTSWAKQWTGASVLAPLLSRDDLVSEISQFEKLVVLVEVKYLPFSQDAKCDFTWDVVKHLKQYQNLSVARKVCIKLQQKISPDMFKSLIFGDLAPQNSLVIFKEWKGLGPRRLYLHLPSCTKQPDCHSLHLSDRVWKDAKNYINTYLGGISQFISVSARFERVCRKNTSMTVEQNQRQIELLIPQALGDVRELQRMHSVKKVHLAYDYGQFGSETFKHKHYYHSEDMLIKFQNDLHSGTFSFAEHEESYKALSSTNPAYIAVVQMAVSSMGKCLVQIGRGHVIDLTRELFTRTHQSPYCITSIETDDCH